MHDRSERAERRERTRDKITKEYQTNRESVW